MKQKKIILNIAMLIINTAIGYLLFYGADTGFFKDLPLWRVILTCFLITAPATLAGINAGWISEKIASLKKKNDNQSFVPYIKKTWLFSRLYGFVGISLAIFIYFFWPDFSQFQWGKTISWLLISSLVSIPLTLLVFACIDGIKQKWFSDAKT